MLCMNGMASSWAVDPRLSKGFGLPLLGNDTIRDKTSLLQKMMESHMLESMFCEIEHVGRMTRLMARCHWRVVL